MSSFELKPQQRGYGRSTTGPILWTHPRESVPPFLVDCVSLSQWQETFDAVKACVELEQETIEEMMKGSMSLTLFMCCDMGMGEMMAAESKVEKSWTDMLRKQHAKYTPLGIQVSFAKELNAVGAGSHRHLSNQIVGLKFDIVQGPRGANNSGDIVERLEKLNSLYKSGAINAEEYEKAKAKILGDS